MKAKQYPNPKFNTPEKEDEYWKTHSPLDEGYEGEVQKSKQKRTSFLSIRLTGDELTKLRNEAAKFGVGPSTYVRQLLKLTIEREYSSTGYPSYTPPSLFPPLYDSSCKHMSKLPYPQEIPFGSTGDARLAARAHATYMKAQKEVEKTYNEIRKKAYDACDKAMEGDPAALQAMLSAIFEVLWATLVIREDDEYKAIQRIVEAQSLP